jgi:2-polyprenyl-3-methyl-5-hydroxy-6-metoxy-1,4-benzoquinol methylase
LNWLLSFSCFPGCSIKFPTDLTEKVLCFRCHQAGELIFQSKQYPIVKCPVCGQIFTGFRFRPEARQDFYDSVEYFEKMYGKFQFHPSQIWHRIVSERRLKLIRRFLTNGKLLDIGCGFGFFLNAARKYNWEVAGVELSKSAVQYAQNFYNLDIFNGEVEHANHAKHTFDVITFWDVLEHVHNPAAFLKSVRHILKKDGLIAFSIPNISSMLARTAKGKWWTLRPEQHLWHFSPQTLNRLLAEQNFKSLVMAKSPFNGPGLTRLDCIVVLARPIA